jgi:hypothetical protein
MTTFRGLVEGIEDNNEINGAAWSDWTDLSSVEEVYGDLSDEDISREQAAGVIDRAISSNGATLADDLRALQIQIFGQEFAGSWWNRA